LRPEGFSFSRRAATKPSYGRDAFPGLWLAESWCITWPFDAGENGGNDDSGEVRQAADDSDDDAPHKGDFANVGDDDSEKSRENLPT